MIAWSEFVTQVKAIVFPDREPENLSAAHTQFIINGMVLAQKHIPCLRESNVNYYEQGDATIRCGVSIIDGPRGRIHAVYAFKPCKGCTRQHYAQVSTRKIMCFVDQFASCECVTESDICNAQVSGDYICEDDYVADYVLGTAENDAVFVCRDREFAVGQSGRLYLAPRFPCGYRLGVHWEGIKRVYDDVDAVNGDPEVIDLIAQYLEAECAQRFDRDLLKYESIMRFHPDAERAGSFWIKLSKLASECREERRVRQDRNCEVFFDDGAVLSEHPPIDPLPARDEAGCVFVPESDEDGDGEDDTPDTDTDCQFCDGEGSMAVTGASETGNVLANDAPWDGIAYVESLERVVADDPNETGLAILDFSTGTPALDYVLPITGAFKLAGLYYDPCNDKIVALIRYGTAAPPFTYRLSFFHPVTGITTELDLGLVVGSELYNAYFCSVDETRIGLLCRSATSASPHLLAVINTVSETVVVSQFYEAVLGIAPTYDFYGLCYVCHLNQFLTFGRLFEGGDNHYVWTFDPATMDIVDEYLVNGAADPVAFNPTYINSTGKVIGWDSTGYYEVNPDTGAFALIENVTVNALTPAYHWKIDRYIGIDSASDSVLIYNPADYSRITVGLTNENSPVEIAVSRTNGNIYVQDTGAPDNIHEIEINP